MTKTQRISRGPHGIRAPRLVTAEPKTNGHGAAPLKLDLGCGQGRRDGFLGVDEIKFPNVDVVTDLRKPWPWKDGSVSEIHCSHFIEHLTNFNEKWERVHFFNELGRVLSMEGKATLIFPHWCSVRYYGDPTHKEPFSEMGFYYISKEWRDANAPATDIKWNPHGYSCDLSATWGYAYHASLQTRNAEHQQYAATFYKEAIADIHATITRKT